jgi:chaperonin cofactor prefoldin
MEKKIETVKHQQHGVQEQCKTLKADIEKTEQENKKLEGLIKDHGEVKR